MALRVLLADESSTIKKVMQLALQDFGVEVRSVAVGLDVLQVARSYQPDLIFTDVLLAKKSGYDVSAELKADPVLNKIPVVLMWSSFMELDEAKARASGADRRLEKPFDADQLRSIVKDVVPRLQENQISQFLSFPDLPEIVETPVPSSSKPTAPPAPQAPSPFQPHKRVPSSLPTPPAPGTRENLSKASEEVEEPDDFMQVPLPGAQSRHSFEKPDREDWRQAGLEQFRVAPDEIDPGTDLADVSDAHISMTDGVENIEIDELEMPPLHSPQARQSAGRGFDPVHAEEILRAQVHEVLENIAWKIIPDIVERVVREEIQRLLKEAERF